MLEATSSLVFFISSGFFKAKEVPNEPCTDLLFQPKLELAKKFYQRNFENLPIYLK